MKSRSDLNRTRLDKSCSACHSGCTTKERAAEVVKAPNSMHRLSLLLAMGLHVSLSKISETRLTTAFQRPPVSLLSFPRRDSCSRYLKALSCSPSNKPFQSKTETRHSDQELTHEPAVHEHCFKPNVSRKYAIEMAKQAILSFVIGLPFISKAEEGGPEQVGRSAAAQNIT